MLATDRDDLSPQLFKLNGPPASTTPRDIVTEEDSYDDDHHDDHVKQSASAVTVTTRQSEDANNSYNTETFETRSLSEIEELVHEISTASDVS